MELVVENEKDTRLDRIDYQNLGFGRYFSDNIFMSEFRNGKWSEGEILPYGKMPYEPGLSTLHYGQSIGKWPPTTGGYP